MVMTAKQADERLRELCLEAWDIALDQGWDVEISARPKGNREGWQFTAFTDRVDEDRKRQRAQRKLQLPLEVQS